MTVVTTLPEPTIERDGARRRFEAAWKLREMTEQERADARADEGGIYAVLAVHHYPDRKYFAASLARRKRSRGNGMTRESFGLFRGTTILEPTPVARYSAKAAEAFFSAAVAEVERRHNEGDEAVLAQFDPDTRD